MKSFETLNNHYVAEEQEVVSIWKQDILCNLYALLILSRSLNAVNPMTMLTRKNLNINCRNLLHLFTGGIFGGLEPNFELYTENNNLYFTSSIIGNAVIPSPSQQVSNAFSFFNFEIM